MKKSELKEMIKARIKGLIEAGKEVVITTNDGTAKTASSAEKLRAKQASDNDDIVTYQKRGVTNESKEFLKMQKRAGLITEAKYRELNENGISINPEELIIEKGWDSWDDVENEIEKIREDFDLLDSKSMWDEAYFKFEEIYHVNPVELKKYFNNKLTEKSSIDLYKILTSPENLQDTLDSIGYAYGAYGDLKGYIENLVKEYDLDWEYVSKTLNKIEQEYKDQIEEWDIEDKDSDLQEASIEE